MQTHNRHYKTQRQIRVSTSTGHSFECELKCTNKLNTPILHFGNRFVCLMLILQSIWHKCFHASGVFCPIDVASVTQYKPESNKNSNTQESSPNVVKVISIPKGSAFKGKNSLALGANSFL